MEKPSWPRNRMSHNRNAARNVLAACASAPACGAMPICRKPHIVICTVGQ